MRNRELIIYSIYSFTLIKNFLFHFLQFLKTIPFMEFIIKLDLHFFCLPKTYFKTSIVENIHFFSFRLGRIILWFTYLLILFLFSTFNIYINSVYILKGFSFNIYNSVPRFTFFPSFTIFIFVGITGQSANSV